MIKRISYFLFLFNFLLFVIPGCNQDTQKKESSPAEINAAPTESVKPLLGKKVDKSSMLGKWSRTDASYQIIISEVLDNGNLSAGYFNPQSINVSTATWIQKDEGIQLYIELRDDNYPGSNYKLTYVPEKDMLTGTYFQAVAGETYEVVFTRSR